MSQFCACVCSCAHKDINTWKLKLFYQLHIQKGAIVCLLHRNDANGRNANHSGDKLFDFVPISDALSINTVL